MINLLIKGVIYPGLLLAFACNTPLEPGQQNSSIYDGVEFEMPMVEEPQFPKFSVSIEDFGAVSGGQFLNSEAFAKAIDAAAENGGGRVIIPRGIWLTGPITLRSNIDLHVEEGALVIFSKDKDLYPLVESSFEGLKTFRCQSPISGKNLENIALTGEGVYDGSGEVWRHVKKSKMNESQWKELLASGGVLNKKGDIWYPSEGARKGMEMPDLVSENVEDYIETKDARRPVMVSLINCEKVLFDGPVFQNSPAWCIHPLMCRDLTIRSIDVRNPWYSQNGDGLDIESCTNSLVYNCTFDVGDDAICIKSGKDAYGRKRGIPTENTIVKNCVVYHGHGGVTVGSEMSGGVRNLHVSNCTFIGTDVGLRFKSRRGRGGVVEKIYISGIDMINIPTNAISFNLYYGGLSVSEMLAVKKENVVQEEFQVDDGTPQFRDISIKNIRCKGAYQAIYLQGLPEMNLENVRMENICMEADNGLFCMDVNGLEIQGLELITKQYPALTFYNSKNVEIEGLQVPEENKRYIAVSGSESGNIRFDIASDIPEENILELGEDVHDENIRIN